MAGIAGASILQRSGLSVWYSALWRKWRTLAEQPHARDEVCLRAGGDAASSLESGHTETRQSSALPRVDGMDIGLFCRVAALPNADAILRADCLAGRANTNLPWENLGDMGREPRRRGRVRSLVKLP